MRDQCCVRISISSHHVDHHPIKLCRDERWKTNDRTTNDRMNKWTNDRAKVQTNERMNDQTVERSKRTNRQNDQTNERTNKGTKRTSKWTKLTEGRGIRNRGVQMKWIEEWEWVHGTNLDTWNTGVTYSVQVQIYICVSVRIYRTYIKTNHMYRQPHVYKVHTRVVSGSLWYRSTFSLCYFKSI